MTAATSVPCSSPAGHAAAWCPRHGREDCWRCHAAVRYVAPPPGPVGPGEHIWCDFDEAETTAPDAASHDPPEDASAAPGAVQVDADNYQTQLLRHLLDLGYSCSVLHGEVVVTCLRGQEYNVRKAIKDFVEKQKEEIHDGI